MNISRSISFLESCRAGSKYEDAGYATPCLVWQGNYTSEYPSARLNGERGARHRLVYRVHNHDEDISGKAIHHLCENKACIEITHLEALTKSEHRLRHIPMVSPDQVPDDVVILMRQSLEDGVPPKRILALLTDRWSAGTLKPILWGHRRVHVKDPIEEVTS